jgi:hypothetical protein
VWLSFWRSLSARIGANILPKGGLTPVIGGANSATGDRSGSPTLQSLSVCGRTGSLTLFLAPLALSCVVALVAPGFVSGEVAGADLEPSIQVGLAGWYRVGQSTEARVVFPQTSPGSLQLFVETVDVDGIPAVFSGKPVAVQGGPVTLSAPFTAGRLGGPLEFLVKDASGAEIWRRRLSGSETAGQAIHPPLRLDLPVWLTAARLPSSFVIRSDEAAIPPAQKSREPWVIGLEDLSNLPVTELGFHPAQVVILPTQAGSGASQSLLERISVEQSAALRRWVHQGGHLVISLAAASAWSGSPLAEWVPIKIDGEVQVQQFSNLESFVGKVAPLRSAGRIRVPRLTNLPNLQAPVRDLGGTPLVAVLPCGLGRVTVLLLDMEKPPLADWMGLPVLLEKITTAGGATGRTSRAAGTATGQKLSQVGVSDLATQWHATQEEFPEIARPGYWWVMLLILLAVALVGPLDYLFVHRLFRRGEWTWVTFPLLALGLVALGLRWGRDFNGSQLRLNQTDLADIDVTTGVVRGRTWATLYSPEHQRISLEVAPQPVMGMTGLGESPWRSQLTFAGSPETGVGGVYRETGLSVSGRRYQLSPDAAGIDNLPILQWSTRTARGDWQGEISAPLAVSKLQSSGFNKVQGSVSHNLPGTLKNCLLVVGGWAYFPKNEESSLKPGVPWQPSGGQSQQRELRALLTGEKRTKLEKKKGALEGEIVTSERSYDPMGRDPGEIWRMITFHEAAGGERYTGLSNSLLSELEMSALAQAGRGVLVGELEVPLTHVVVDGSTQPATRQTTLIRLVLPVEQVDRISPNQLPKLNEPRLVPGPAPDPAQPTVETP